MFKYRSQKQLSIFDFHTGFESKLNPENRWVKMAKMLDLDKLDDVYAKSLSSDLGAGSIEARVVICALIIKYIEKKDDRGTIEAFQENLYMQFFLGFDHFTSKPVFDPSLFVHIRKRLNKASFDIMNKTVMSASFDVKDEDADNQYCDSTKEQSDEENEPSVFSESEAPAVPNKGKLQLDATVCDAYIKYPTDLNLLNESREKAEELLDLLVKPLNIKRKLKTYRRVARKNYLNIAKKKNKSKALIRKGIRQQLGYLKRDINSMHNILDNDELSTNIFSKTEKAYRETIQELYRQQEQTYRTKTTRIEHRIVSIHQSFIRPVVRGKDGKK